MRMRLVVGLKYILDPEIPPRDFRIDEEARRPIQGRASLVISPFDENALELALQMKDRDPATQVVALSAGPASSEEALRKALSLRVDEAVRVETEPLEEPDGAQTALLLAAAVRRLQGDVLLVGRQAGDWDRGQTGPIAAEILGWPCVTAVSRIEVADGRLRLRHEGPDGLEVVEAAPPLVVTVTNDEANQLRIPKARDILATRSKQVARLTLADLGLAAGEVAARTRVTRLYVPVEERQCEWIEGDDAEAKARALADRLLALKVL
ncbi:MAG: electron transfer flavoprotein subunit beta/FixA family protein [Clostridia bacterium]|nr:electron transfer flavoprotein subunit beta/FixA family protein [Clostridia bacterium]MCL6520902.1 electron transfer flavoprotein subunit beta/FixA family protein [Bacillota bacterium]